MASLSKTSTDCNPLMSDTNSAEFERSNKGNTQMNNRLFLKNFFSPVWLGATLIFLGVQRLPLCGDCC